MQDNLQMHLHHASTISLLLVSFLLNLHRAGRYSGALRRHGLHCVWTAGPPRPDNSAHKYSRKGLLVKSRKGKAHVATGTIVERHDWGLVHVRRYVRCCWALPLTWLLLAGCMPVGLRSLPQAC